MDPATVERALQDRVDRLADRLESRWSSVPHSERVVAGDQDPPDTPAEMPTWAAVCLVGDGERVLYVRDESHGHLEWEPPGGRAEPGEAPHETAAREAREEVGVEPAVRELLAIETLAWEYGDGRRYPLLQAVFGAERVGGRAHPREADIVTVEWFPAEDVPETAQYADLVGETWPDR